MRPGIEVLAVTSFGTLGGAERWLVDVLDHTDDLLPHALVLGRGPFVDALQERGLAVRVLPTGRGGVHVLRSAAHLTGILRRHRPQVVLANGVKAAAVAVPAARLARVPVVWAKHDFARDGTLARPLGRLSDAVIAVSAEVGRATGRDDVIVAPPSAPQSPADPAAAAEMLRARGVPTGAGPTVGMATRLVPIKGVDDTIRALAHFAASDWRLVVMGADDPTAPGERRRLEQLARQVGVADRVHLLGHVPDAGRWLAAFDAVAVVTRTTRATFGREGFGMVALEALRAGVPVVGADDSPEVARLAARAGRLVTAGDPVSIAQGLADLRAHGPAVGPELARIVADHPAPQDVAARVVGALRRASDGRPRGNGQSS